MVVEKIIYENEINEMHNVIAIINLLKLKKKFLKYSIQQKTFVQTIYRLLIYLLNQKKKIMIIKWRKNCQVVSKQRVGTFIF